MRRKPTAADEFGYYKAPPTGETIGDNNQVPDDEGDCKIFYSEKSKMHFKNGSWKPKHIIGERETKVTKQQPVAIRQYLVNSITFSFFPAFFHHSSLLSSNGVSYNGIYQSIEYHMIGNQLK
jgi:hypothetical protein